MQVVEDPDVDNYLKWGDRVGIDHSKIVYPIRFSEGYIGSIAKETIFPGESIIKVPNTALLTTNSALNSQLAELYQEADELFDHSNPAYEDLVISTFLVYVKHKGDPFWSTFVEMQPKDIPILQDWSSQEIDQLQNPYLKFDLKKRLAEDMGIWATWKQHLSSFQSYFSESMLEWSEFYWAWKVISTRAFGKFVPHTTLAPIAEFLNHTNVSTFYSYNLPDEEPDASLRYSDESDQDHDDLLNLPIKRTLLYYNDLVKVNLLSRESAQTELLEELCNEATAYEDKIFSEIASKAEADNLNTSLEESPEAELRIVSGETYQKGSEVFLSYGRYSNRQLLTYYGFAFENNKYDYAPIYITLDEIATSQQVPYINENLEKKVIEIKAKKNLLQQELLNCFRAIHWDFEHGKEAFFAPKSLELEKKVLEETKTFLKGMLGNFETSLEEDLELLSQNLPLKLRFAVIYRSEIKKIIHKQVEYISILERITNNLVSGQASNQVTEDLETSEDPQSIEAIKNYLASLLHNLSF